MSELVQIKARECDTEELAIVYDAIVEENLVLQRELEVARENAGYFMEAARAREITEADILKARLGIHSSASIALYMCIGALCNGDLLAHPTLAAVIVSLNLFAWTIGSTIRRFG